MSLITYNSDLLVLGLLLAILIVLVTFNWDFFCWGLCWEQLVLVTYNCDLFVLGPELAILSTPLPVWVRLGFISSLKASPHADSPPKNKIKILIEAY